jgi:hypothetical protein
VLRPNPAYPAEFVTRVRNNSGSDRCREKLINELFLMENHQIQANGRAQAISAFRHGFLSTGKTV